MTDFSVRVVLADDHQVVRQGIRDFLVMAGIEVVGEATTGPEAYNLVADLHPDVAVLDLQMPGYSGIEVTRRLRELQIPVSILVLTAYNDDPYIMAALEAGVNGYILKTADSEDIVRAVEAVSKHQSVLDPTLIKTVMQAVAGRTGERPEPLTDREHEVLQEAARGLTNKAISLNLKISDRTVQGHLRNIYEKLDVANRTEAVVKATQMGLLSPPEP
jgi:DNA-binding NarL/FixJ family response regulator